MQHGRNFKGAGGRSDQCSVKARVLSLGLKKDRESPIRTGCGSEFQTDGAENRKARLEKCVLVNGWTGSGTADDDINPWSCSRPYAVVTTTIRLHSTAVRLLIKGH